MRVLGLGLTGRSRRKKLPVPHIRPQAGASAASMAEIPTCSPNKIRCKPTMSVPSSQKASRCRRRDCYYFISIDGVAHGGMCPHVAHGGTCLPFTPRFLHQAGWNHAENVTCRSKNIRACWVMMCSIGLLSAVKIGLLWTSEVGQRRHPNILWCRPRAQAQRKLCPHSVIRRPVWGRTLG